ncbi:MAG TPA: DUF2911 domain-containing protein [Balneolaceae bacterium]|nr:DUF2911 domain-containing protein [Balneolaceae bacterium]
MKYSGLFLVLATLLISCDQQSFQAEPDRAAFISYLGVDTLAVEQFEKTAQGIVAHVILRSPETTFSSYELEMDDTGAIETMTRKIYPKESGFSGEGIVVQSIQKDGDSLRVEMSGAGGTREFAIESEPGLLPFIDMVHWPYELALNQAAVSGKDTVNQRMLTGSSVSDFIIAAIDADSMTIRHPFRGVMGVDVNEAGELLTLDAGLTTRKLRVERVAGVDLNQAGERFAAADLAGNPFGALSGAEEAEFTVKGETFRLEYGTPLKRGRELFGGIVPWGEVWRTGANRATHFYTPVALRFENLYVPPGEYTLFSIPEEDGGVLIINTQTGQNGQSYDPDRDLGRVPMEITTKEDTTERFTITVDEIETGGVLRLIWGETILSAEFEMNES